MIPADFKLSNKAASKICPTIAESIAYLDTLPYKELVTASQLASAINRSARNFRHYTGDPALERYRMWLKTQYVFGSRKTIKELQRRLSK